MEGHNLDADPDSPGGLFLQLGAEQQVGEEEDVTQLPGTFDQLHHEAIPQQLPVLPTGYHVVTLPECSWGRLPNTCHVLLVNKKQTRAATAQLQIDAFILSQAAILCRRLDIHNSCDFRGGVNKTTVVTTFGTSSSDDLYRNHSVDQQ